MCSAVELNVGLALFLGLGGRHGPKGDRLGQDGFVDRLFGLVVRVFVVCQNTAGRGRVATITTSVRLLVVGEILEFPVALAHALVGGLGLFVASFHAASLGFRAVGLAVSLALDDFRASGEFAETSLSLLLFW